MMDPANIKSVFDALQTLSLFTYMVAVFFVLVFLDRRLTRLEDRQHDVAQAIAALEAKARMISVPGSPAPLSAQSPETIAAGGRMSSSTTRRPSA